MSQIKTKKKYDVWSWNGGTDYFILIVLECRGAEGSRGSKAVGKYTENKRAGL